MPGPFRELDDGARLVQEFAKPRDKTAATEKCESSVHLAFRSQPSGATSPSQRSQSRLLDQPSTADLELRKGAISSYSANGLDGAFALAMTVGFNPRDTARSSVRAPRRGLVARYTSCAPLFLSALRVVAAFMFLLAGTSKLFAFPMPMPQGGSAPLWSQLGVGGVLEVLGGGLLAIGLFTRPVAFILAGEMAVAYFQFHFPKNFWPTVNQGVPAVLYCFVFLYLSAAGAGPWSIDALRRARQYR